MHASLISSPPLTSDLHHHKQGGKGRLVFGVVQKRKFRGSTERTLRRGRETLGVRR
ncbi:unnamed protein product [Hymenolepis diminuta]|uniref:Uncharacterized protein n=1 Tax=Hymenolepis diminuta TaxID=6216 RepID=A0A564Z3E0_HYMDI|nr:unnamed protein product [Hymenolepis diminuta]